MNFFTCKKVVFRKTFFLLLIFLIVLIPCEPELYGKKKDAPDIILNGCTSIMVGKLASTDGSTITSHTCDGPYRNWVEIVPHEKHGKGEMKSIYTGYHWTEFPKDMRGLNKTGEIPETEETYAFLNTAYPAMNEHQLGMGETTIIGKNRLRSNKGMFQIEELQRIVLERTKTAREAIRLIGKLVKKYGYRGQSECLTFIDPNEVWHFEIFGPGMDKVGGVWAAVRIPDGHVGVSANYPRIGKINLKKPDFYMASENIFSLAKELGWWDPKSKEPFKVWKIYGGQKPRLRKIYKDYCRIREWWVLNTLAPSLKLDINAKELPFSVKPDKKVSARDVMALLRTNYSGTEYDMTKNLGKKDPETGKVKISSAANPWMTRAMIRLFSDIKPDLVKRQRLIAINRCSYSTVIQCRNWLPDAIGGIVWLSFDNPAFTPRIPIFSGVKELIPDFSFSNQKKYRTDSAAWAFRRAVRLAQPRWQSNKEVIDKAVKAFEERAFAELPDLEKRVVKLLKKDPKKAVELITSYVNAFSRATIHEYWELGNRFWSLYGSGF